MILKLAIPSFVAFFIAAGAFAQTLNTPAVPLSQAISPDRYTKLSAEQRQFYVAGVLDAGRAFVQHNNPALTACLNNTTIAEVTDIVDRKMMSLKPELRSDMPMAIHNTVLMNCDRRDIQK